MSSGAPVAIGTAKTAAMPAKGVARRTRPRVRNGMTPSRGRFPGNTPIASPPLAGWKVRRTQSVRADRPARPHLRMPLSDEILVFLLSEARLVLQAAQSQNGHIVCKLATARSLGQNIDQLL